MVRRTALLVLILMILVHAAALAVSYTKDGGMVVNGNGTDDFSNIQQADPNASYTTIILPGEDSDVTYDENGNVVTPGPGPTFAPCEPIDISVKLENGEEQAVNLLYLGTMISTVTIGREKMVVPSSSLIYETDKVENDQRYAMINAKKTGYATMHLRSSAKSDVVGRMTTNRLCLVLKVGKKYTRVWCDGFVGYIKTSSLTFLSAPTQEIRHAALSYNGKTKSRNTINIRQNGKNGSRILKDLICGTQMVVFGTNEDGWVEVEIEGWRAWVQDKFVTYISEPEEIPVMAFVAAEPSPVPPPDTDNY